MHTETIFVVIIFWVSRMQESHKNLKIKKQWHVVYMADLAYVMLIRFLPNQKLVSGSFGIENGLNRYYTDIGFGAVFSEKNIL